MNPPLKPLPGQACRFVATRDYVENLMPGVFDRLPFARRVFAENLIRRSPAGLLAQTLDQVLNGKSDIDFPFYPARVVLQDLLGTPALVDLAGLRDAVAEGGGDPARVNPAVPTQLVVDHSLNVDVGGTVSDALSQNMAIEQRKNVERFEFLAWAQRAFSNVGVVMPGNGILHQINIEKLSPVVQVHDGIAFVDTLVGTDSHTTMINALGVVGWGVGGIEAESVMLGRPIWMRLPPIIGVELTGTRQAGVQATDIVLALTEYLRGQSVVGAILEFDGEGAKALTLADRATIANMSPEFGATASIFAIDEQTLDYLRLTGREPAQVQLVETYAKAQGLWADTLTKAEYERRLSFDLGTIGRSIAGPSNPHQRVLLKNLKAAGIARNPGQRDEALLNAPLPEGAIVIAAITSCTNTSNPRNLIAAGLAARKALARGVQRKPWVKTSFAPGSRAAEGYLSSADLLGPLQVLGFGIVGYGCTSCNGMSGPLPEAIEAEILERDLHTVAVLSGNRNFNGRIHPRVNEAFLASPALVVAYAIAGSIRIDIENEPLAIDPQGQPVMLADLWPSDAEIDAILAEHLRSDQYRVAYATLFDSAQPGSAPESASVSPRFAWREDSTYIRRPPYWQADLTCSPRANAMRAIALLGDNISTDDLSPSGAILAESAAGEFLLAHGVSKENFNSYGTHRGDHVVAVRATFANNRLKNEMTPGVEGSVTRLEPEGTVMPLFDAARKYVEREQELIVVAGKNYGCGSSRDWAAKGVRLLGVRVVLCESFERIHRTNLVGMGVLPIEFEAGVTRKTLGLDGSELYALDGFDGSPQPGAQLTLVITHGDGRVTRAAVRCRIDTDDEREMFTAGGLLPRIASELLAQ
ncbi:MAG: Fe/S-dependent 2-methylisocitrate dehydratase AcnD [Proteobacteria bacterium]|nr:Fe/S-dependent 2-methylisocitrate dehydratase AcnD [Pseudomonadota bacterium]